MKIVSRKGLGGSKHRYQPGNHRPTLSGCRILSRAEKERLKEEFRLFSKNLFASTPEVAEKLWKTGERYLEKYPFLMEIVKEVDPRLYCANCGKVIEDFADQIVNSGQVICHACGTTVCWRSQAYE